MSTAMRVWIIIAFLTIGTSSERFSLLAFCPSSENSKQRTPRTLSQTNRPSPTRTVQMPVYSSIDDEDNDDFNDELSSLESTRRKQGQKNIRKRVASMARNMVIKPLSYATPMPQAIGAVLKDATLGAIDMAVDEVMNRSAKTSRKGVSSLSQLDQLSDDAASEIAVDVLSLVDEAFAPLEATLEDLEYALANARQSLKNAKTQATYAMNAIQAAAIAQAEGAVTAVAAAEERLMADLYANVNEIDVSTLTFEDVDYGSSEMAPPFLNEDQCLVPGEPIIRVEKAPENSRRIFAGIDIMASVDTVWNVLTDYCNLQKVVPNLVVNEVMNLYQENPNCKVDTTLSEEEQCEQISLSLKGALLRQVGGAKVAGINFSARTKLEVREWPQGLPDFAHFLRDDVYQGKTRAERAQDYTKVKLRRYRFPRPFAISSLPTKDISMQSIKNDDGEFRMYQGVWRMQPLPGCAPKGQDAMRLTYAVEVSPRAYLPVRLVEGRIAADLCTNLEAIRDYVESASAVPSAR
ncbi:hypothetical protein MPSEU_000879300 [Mayamaea pseudoterrestris]|nr:hypothetical protein MPSEU_000879300 [Mayamaea pseudoterrestris]